MFEASNKREASIMLCLFPHLSEFIAVDCRTETSSGPAVHVLSFQEIFTDSFKSTIESNFSSLVRKDDLGLLDMIGLPQEVESMVRAESMKQIVKSLNHTSGIDSIDIENGIGVLFFTRALLTIHTDQLESAMDDLFQSILTDSQMSRLNTEMQRLLAEEREAEEKIRQRDMARLIKGEPGSFVTLWESNKNG